MGCCYVYVKPFQSERQLVMYEDSHYWFTPYHTETQKTKVDFL